MTDQEINTAIAEACGWQDIKRCTRRLKPDAQGVALRGINPNGDHTGGATEYASVPSYTTNLNAMHEAENLVMFRAEYGKGLKYSQALRRITEVDRSTERWQWNATALQRAEAFLRTLNKWKE